MGELWRQNRQPAVSHCVGTVGYELIFIRKRE